MLQKPIEELEGKNIALVAMGQSQIDFHLSQVHSHKFDEVWAVNAMIGVLKKVDRAFILDPMSRFLDTEDAGNMTFMMRDVLPKIEYPIYSCQLENRVPAVEHYPLEQIANYAGSAYFNNTIAYAIAFALWSKVSQLSIFGVDFTYKSNMHFAEAGRGCVEFWIGNCINRGISVAIAPRSSLLDTDVPSIEKLYGYHRLDDPVVTYQDKSGIKACHLSQVEKEEKKPVGMIGRKDLEFEPVEPEKY